MLKVLDCTLRDGGYINNWVFGESSINKIVDSLDSANIDFIELGYVDRNGLNLFSHEQRRKRKNYKIIFQTIPQEHLSSFITSKPYFQNLLSLKF